MAVERGNEREQIIQSVLRWTLGRLADWSEPLITKTVGPYFPNAFAAFASDRANLVEECRRFFENVDDAALKANFNAKGQAVRAADKETQQHLTNKADSLMRQEPRWFEGGFGHPDHLADFGYWSKMAHLSLDELLCLSVGIAPKNFPKASLASIYSSNRDLHPVIEFLGLRHELLRREFDRFNDGRSIYPTDARKWIENVTLEVPIVFLRTVGIPESQVIPENVQVVEKESDSREKTSLAKLLVAMAVDHYGYDPVDGRSPIPKEIQDMMASLGLDMSQETIRKYLQIGAKLLPKGWKPNSD